MVLTLKNYETVLPKTLLKQAEKSVVRECDQEEKGRFVAYVDEGSETFDVSITISPKQEVTEHSCECKQQNTFCRHKAALLIHVSTNKKTKATIKGKKKENATLALLDEIDAAELREWVKELLLKNKEIEIAFTQAFTIRTGYTAEEVAKITKDAVKAVVGNKKNLEPTQVKRIVELWSEVHKPLIELYKSNVTDENAFVVYNNLILICQEYRFILRTGSSRIDTYIRNILKQTVTCLNNIEIEESWDKAVQYFVDHLVNSYNNINTDYLQHLDDVMKSSGSERRARLISSVFEHGNATEKNHLYKQEIYVRTLLNWVVENDLFDTYSQYFAPLHWQNSYNYLLILSLIDNNETQRAEKYCWDQIKINSDEQYNLQYLECLKRLYVKRGDEAGLAAVVEQLVFHNYNFDDYLYVYERKAGEEEKKQWRNKVVGKARNIHYLDTALHLYTKIMQHEGKYKKILKVLNHKIPYAFILECLDELVAIDKELLLRKLVQIDEDIRWKKQVKSDEEIAAIPALCRKLKQYYTPLSLKNAIRVVGGEWIRNDSNSIFAYLQNVLEGGKPGNS